MAGVSGKGKMMQAGVSKVVHKATGASAGSKPGDGATSAMGVPGTPIPTKKVANPNGFANLSAAGSNKHSGIAKGPGKPGMSKK